MIVTAGIDVSKDKLDIFLSNGEFFTMANERKAIDKAFKSRKEDLRILMEATSKYHRLAHRLFAEKGYSVMVINPCQSRRFAQSMNILCKTDRVDAGVLCEYGRRMPFKETPLATQVELVRQDLSRHLEDLKQLKHRTESRLRTSEGFIAKSLKRTIKLLNEEIEKTESEQEENIKADEASHEAFKLLSSIPGIGPSTAILLLSMVRELGTVSKTEIAALLGLAPMNCDSGTQRGKRRIKGGRHDVRARLYMPILGAATKHNKRLKALYENFILAGKPPKVALTACMRKLIIWANAILASGKPWQENYV